jgi:hypothetical protein
MSDTLNTAITRSELENLISKLKTRKSPRLDGVSNDMITHLGTGPVNKLLNILNLSNVPKIWGEAIMIPILQPGKDNRKYPVIFQWIE